MISNPIGWVQVQINGGFRKLFFVAGIYLTFAVVILYLIYRGFSLDRGPSVLPQFAFGAFSVLTMIMLAVLFFGSSTAIKKSIHRDFTTNMITSHRNTAIGGPTAVWGYLTGPTSQVFVLTLVNFLLCTVLAILARPAITGVEPALVLVVFLCPALMLFTLDILLAFSTRGAVVVTPIVALFNIFVTLRLLDICPGLALLMVPVDTGSLSRIQSGQAVTERIVAMFFQLGFAFTFFLAAARKYARDDVAGFNEPLAFCLLALATLAGVVGLGLYQNSSVSWTPDLISKRPVQIVATLVPLACVGMIPVAHAAWRRTEWMRRRRKDEAFAAKGGRGPRGFLETAIIATVVVFGIFAACGKWVLGDHAEHVFSGGGVPRVAWIVAAFLLALVTAGAIYHFVYSKTAKAGFAFLMLLLVFWVMPIIAEFAWGQFMRLDQLERGEEPSLTFVFGCSPVGTWILSLCDVKGPIAAGLGFQALVAAGFSLLARRAKP